MGLSSDRGPAAGEPPLLEIEHVSKRFWGTQALADVSLSIRQGEFIGLVGENGAGKSTLLNILCGCERPDSGRLVLRGRPFEPGSYHEATLAGVFRTFQELALVPNLSVYENLYLSHERHFETLGLLSRREMLRTARELLDEFDHAWIDPEREVFLYDFATRQVLEIVKAFALSRLLEVESPTILLDEPTAALSRDEIDFLFRLLDRLRGRATVVFVSHRLTEVIELSDRLVVLKDGQNVAELENANVSEADLHLLMVGRVRDEEFYKENRQRDPEERPVLRVRGLTVPDAVHDVDLDVHAGEILGVAGVMGAGKSVLAQAIFGAQKKVTGTIEVAGKTPRAITIESMMQLGVGYVGPDRQEEGVLGGLPVAWNITLARLAQRGKQRMFISPRDETRVAGDLVARLRIKTPTLDTLAANLSGGNQQKVVLSRWLAFGVTVLVLDNPTRGVDAGAKEEIYELLRDLTANGVGVLLVSDDLLELIGLSTRVLVMKDGRVVREVPSPTRAKPHEADLVEAMV